MKEYFVIKGSCKSFLHSPEGEEITLSFFMSNSILSPFTTRNKDGKYVINIRCLTAVEVATFNAEKFEKLMIDDLEIRHFGTTVLRNELMEKVQKEIGLASLPSKSRLQILRTQYPNIENLIAHSDIASYLGITTISLSRLRTQS
ncbi:MAG: CRP-like cAMP-binding protein [Vicingaceae bacterium]|jgi:CRP-like cAMP-binding protein